MLACCTVQVVSILYHSCSPPSPPPPVSVTVHVSNQLYNIHSQCCSSTVSVYCSALLVHLCESTTFSPNFPMQCIPPPALLVFFLQCIYSPSSSTTTYMTPSSSAGPSNCVHHCEVGDVTWACTRCLHHAILTMATVWLLCSSPWQPCACCIIHHGNSVLVAFFTMATVCLLHSSPWQQCACCVVCPRLDG